MVYCSPKAVQQRSFPPECTMQRMLMAMLLSFILSLPALAAAAPELAVEQPVFDFGTVAQGKKVEHTFVLKNRGNAPLTIKNTSTSCGCTVAVVSSPVIQPGKTGDIKATFDTANFAGHMSKTVSVESDDPKNPVYTLTLKGNVVEEVTISPRQINFGTLKAGSGKEATLSLENRGSRKLEILEVSSSIPNVTIKSISKNIVPAGGISAILISASSRPGDRFLSGYISIRTNNASKPMITIPFYGSIAN